jgi:REP element-mobilizing transposase RayT
MPRPPRIHAPGAFYHVTLRGNHQQPVFFRESDRDLLDHIVAESLERLTARLHAYCWMTNHVHLLVQVSDAPLGLLMLRIASTYARKVQSRLETTGHLFERRYHASLVDADNYLLAVIRYIHLNPVAAALVKDPAEYPWSSHGTYMGLQDRRWVCTDFVMRLIGMQSGTALHRYKELINGPDQVEWGTGALVPNRGRRCVCQEDPGWPAATTITKIPGAACRRMLQAISGQSRSTGIAWPRERTRISPGVAGSPGSL